MSESAELGQFLDVVSSVVSPYVVVGAWELDPHRRNELVQALQDADVTDLALETLDLEDSLDWLVATVAKVSGISASVGYALAARYLGQRVLSTTSELDARAHATSAVITADNDKVVVPRLLGGRTIVVVQADVPAVGLVSDAPANLTDASATGLRDADLGQAPFGSAPVTSLTGVDVRAVVRECALLFGAVSLGIAESSASISASYAAERRQFGTTIDSFTGLRAIVVRIQQHARTLRALIDAALRSPDLAPALAVAEVAGSTALEAALDAVQVHGGYGYIDEYPTTVRVRDAISASARAIPSRIASALDGVRAADARVAL